MIPSVIVGGARTPMGRLLGNLKVSPGHRDERIVNVNAGRSLGHPIGMSGARLVL